MLKVYQKIIRVKSTMRLEDYKSKEYSETRRLNVMSVMSICWQAATFQSNGFSLQTIAGSHSTTR